MRRGCIILRRGLVSWIIWGWKQTLREDISTDSRGCVLARTYKIFFYEDNYYMVSR